MNLLRVLGRIDLGRLFGRHVTSLFPKLGRDDLGDLVDREVRRKRAQRQAGTADPLVLGTRRRQRHVQDQFIGL